MNYIYDILLNLQRRPYDFFEWNESDEIIHVRKIPFFRVETNDLYDIKNNQIKFDELFLKKIKNRCEVFTNRNVKVLNYVCLFSDSKEVIGVELNDKGEKVRSSKLLIDEELDVNDVCDNIEVSKISFKVNKIAHQNIFKTRKELKIYDYILKQFITDNYTKLKYLYFECFDKEEEEFSKIIEALITELNNNWNNVSKSMYNFFRLSSQRK